MSGDLLVKLALAGLALAGVAYMLRKASESLPDIGGAASRAWNTATDAAWAITPWNNENVIYQTANAPLSAALGYEETWGGALYDWTHRDPVAYVAPRTAEGTFHSGGQWGNNPSAYTAPSGQGGAAFGIYPRP